jgi:hypothetical protein
MMTRHFDREPGAPDGDRIDSTLSDIVINSKYWLSGCSGGDSPSFNVEFKGMYRRMSAGEGTMSNPSKHLKVNRIHPFADFRPA